MRAMVPYNRCTSAAVNEAERIHNAIGYVVTCFQQSSITARICFVYAPWAPVGVNRRSLLAWQHMVHVAVHVWLSALVCIYHDYEGSPIHVLS